MPVRTCVGCRGEADKRSLLRLVRRPGGVVEVDWGQRAEGRGAYLHADAACLEAARKRRALERALKAAPPDRLWWELAARPPRRSGAGMVERSPAAPGAHPFPDPVPRA